MYRFTIASCRALKRLYLFLIKMTNSIIRGINTNKVKNVKSNINIVGIRPHKKKLMTVTKSNRPNKSPGLNIKSNPPSIIIGTIIVIVLLENKN